MSNLKKPWLKKKKEHVVAYVASKCFWMEQNFFQLIDNFLLKLNFCKLLKFL